MWPARTGFIGSLFVRRRMNALLCSIQCWRRAISDNRNASVGMSSLSPRPSYLITINLLGVFTQCIKTIAPGQKYSRIPENTREGIANSYVRQR